MIVYRADLPDDGDRAADRRPVDTGLLDQHGNRIFRHEIHEPMGFCIGNGSPTVSGS